MIGRVCVSQGDAVGVDGPLDVLRRAEVLLDARPQGGERAQLVVGQAEPVLRRGRLDAHRAAAGTGPDGQPLVSPAPVHDGAAVGVDDDVVGVDRAGHHRLAETGAGVDDGAAAPARDRVGGEQHAGHLCVDHLLHDDGDADPTGVDALPGPVGDRALGPQRRPASPYGVHHLRLADHGEVRVLLAREAGERQVLGGGRRAHGHRDARPHPPVRRRDVPPRPRPGPRPPAPGSRRPRHAG